MTTYKKDDKLIQEDRKVFALIFVSKVRELAGKGLGTSIRECLIRSTYPNILQDNQEHPCFNMTDKEWVDKWKALSLYLPEKDRRRKRPKFDDFLSDLEAVFSQENRSLRIGQVLVAVSGNSNCPDLFYLESSDYKMGWL